MIVKSPLNFKPLHPDQFINSHMLGEVTSQLIYEPSTTNLHPEGLYSEVIFGQLGTAERVTKPGFISLNTKILAPMVFKNVGSLKPILIELMEGKVYAKFNTKTKFFDFCSRETTGARTGYGFFIECFPNIQFKETESISTVNKIKTIEEAKRLDCALVDKLIVLPAGMRDIKIKNGREAIEEVNKIYTSIMRIADELKSAPVDNPLLAQFYDGIRYKMQSKVYEIYQHHANFYTGKNGFGESKYTSRAVTYGTRNVVTAAELIADTPDDVRYMRQDESLVPLFQACKMYQPLFIHTLKTIFFNQIFNISAAKAPLINKKTLNLEYADISDAIVTQYSDNSYYEDLLNNFQNVTMRNKPVSVYDTKGLEHYLFLLYDRGDSSYMFRDINLFKEQLSKESVNIPDIDNVDNLHLLKKYKIDKSTSVIVKDSALAIYNLEDAPKILHILVDEDTYKLISTRSDFTKDSSNGGTISSNKGDIVVYRTISTKSGNLNNKDLISNGSNLISNYNVIDLKTILMDESRDVSLDSTIRDMIKDPNSIDMRKVRPLTYLEMFYIACVVSTQGKFGTITRYPVLEPGSIYPSNIKIITTSPNRLVRLNLMVNSNSDSVLLPHYPVFTGVEKNGHVTVAPYVDSLIFHPSQAAGLDACF